MGERSDYPGIKYDCKFFRGTVPCKPNKERGKICTCDEHIPVETKILIIKLGAIGDVIRSTPLLDRFRKIYPNVHISWITWSPDILPAGKIEVIYPFDFKSVYILKNQSFDIAINLDKDFEACALLKDVRAKQKFGFTLKDEHIDVATPAARHKLITGIFDQYSIKNNKSYPEEIFEICHMDFKGEDYVLDYDPELYKKWNKLEKKADGKNIIGLNTGCGERWQTRLWPEEYWVELIGKLQNAGYFPVVLGGPAEDKQNKKYEALTGVCYPGTMPLQEFIALTAHCDLVTTAVSMMMHIAIGLKIPLVLFNNIFNKNEFEMYDRGVILEPSTGCDDFYGQVCSRSRHCMKDLPVTDVMKAIEHNVAQKV